MNSRRARIFTLVLDPGDPTSAVLIAAIDMYQAIKEAERPVSSDKFGSTCPYCDRSFWGETERAGKQSLSAHIRQIHPVEYERYYRKHKK